MKKTANKALQVLALLTLTSATLQTSAMQEQSKSASTAASSSTARSSALSIAASAAAEQPAISGTPEENATIDLSYENLRKYFNFEYFTACLAAIFTKHYPDGLDETGKELYEAKIKTQIVEALIDAILWQNIPLTIRATKGTVSTFTHTEKFADLLKFIAREYFTPKPKINTDIPPTQEEINKQAQEAKAKRIRYLTLLKECLKFDAIKSALPIEKLNLSTSLDFTIKWYQGDPTIKISEILNLRKIANAVECDLDKYFNVAALEDICDQILRKEPLSRYHVLNIINFKPLILWFAEQILEDGQEFDASEEHIQKISRLCYGALWHLSNLLSADRGNELALLFEGLSMIALKERSKNYPMLDYEWTAEERALKIELLRKKVAAAETALNAYTKECSFEPVENIIREWKVRHLRSLYLAAQGELAAEEGNQRAAFLACEAHKVTNEFAKIKAELEIRLAAERAAQQQQAPLLASAAATSTHTTHSAESSSAVTPGQNSPQPQSASNTSSVAAVPLTPELAAFQAQIASNPQLLAQFLAMTQQTAAQNALANAAAPVTTQPGVVNTAASAPSAPTAITSAQALSQNSTVPSATGSHTSTPVSEQEDDHKKSSVEEVD